MKSRWKQSEFSKKLNKLSRLWEEELMKKNVERVQEFKKSRTGGNIGKQWNQQSEMYPTQILDSVFLEPELAREGYLELNRRNVYFQGEKLQCDFYP